MAIATVVVMSADAAVMVTVEARAMAMAVMSLAASGSSNGGDGTTTEFCGAILQQYTDVIDVRSDDNGNHTPAIDESDIDGGVADFANGMQRACRGQGQWRGEGGNTGGGSGGGGGSKKRKHSKANGGRGN